MHSFLQYLKEDVSGQDLHLATSTSAQDAAFLKEADMVMKSSGWTLTHRSKESATVDIEYMSRALGKSLSISAWHGTGSYGDGKQILSIYYRDASQDSLKEFKTLNLSDVENDGPGRNAKQQFVDTGARSRYLQNLARAMAIIKIQVKK